MADDADIALSLKQTAVFRMQENLSKIRKCLSELDDESLWLRPNENSNSIGNLILHLNGNITQYIISSLGKTSDVRKRDEEFQTTGGFAVNELIDKHSIVIEKAIAIIRDVTDEELLRKRPVQVYEMNGVEIVVHVVEHYSYHCGQIAFYVKQLKNKDLGFYSGIDLSRKRR